MTRTREPGLSAATCLVRLGRTRTAYLACSERALPSVLPVAVRVVGERIYVEAPSERHARLLIGQLVAVGSGRPARLVRDGWQVIARGVLKPVAGRPTLLVMDPDDLQGWVQPRPGSLL